MALNWHCLGCGELLKVHGCAVTAGRDNEVVTHCRAPIDKRRRGWAESSTAWSLSVEAKLEAERLRRIKERAARCPQCHLVTSGEPHNCEYAS